MNEDLSKSSATNCSAAAGCRGEPSRSADMQRCDKCKRFYWHDWKPWGYCGVNGDPKVPYDSCSMWQPIDTAKPTEKV